MDVDDVIEELKKEKLLKNYIENNSDKVREYLQKRKDSITKSDDSHTITWDDLLEDMKRDIGEYTDIFFMRVNISCNCFYIIIKLFIKPLYVSHFNNLFLVYIIFYT